MRPDQQAGAAHLAGMNPRTAPGRLQIAGARRLRQSNPFDLSWRGLRFLDPAAVRLLVDRRPFLMALRTLLVLILEVEQPAKLAVHGDLRLVAAFRAAVEVFPAPARARLAWGQIRAHGFLQVRTLASAFPKFPSVFLVQSPHQSQSWP